MLSIINSQTKVLPSRILPLVNLCLAFLLRSNLLPELGPCDFGRWLFFSFTPYPNSRGGFMVWIWPINLPFPHGHSNWMNGPMKPWPGTSVEHWEGKADVARMHDVSLQMLGSLWDRKWSEREREAESWNHWVLASLKSDLPLDFSNSGTNKCPFD